MLTANWQMNRHVSGTKQWAIAQWFWSLALLILLQTVLPPALTTLVSYIMIFTGSMFLLRGMSNYQGVKSLPFYVETLIVLLVSFAAFYFSYVEVNLNWRVIILSLFSVAAMIRCVIILWPTFIHYRGVGLVVGLGLALHALFFLIRAILTLQFEIGGNLLQRSQDISIVWLLVEGSLFIFWSTFSFAMLTNLSLQKGLRNLADKDHLTELLNRRAVFEHSQNLINELHGDKFSILVLDLDRFKVINDTYGHAVGDQVLQRFSKDISRELRNEDIFGRTGGEEFIIALPHTSTILAQNIAQRLCDVVRNIIIELDGQQIKFTVSIGIASSYAANRMDLRELIHHADKAMYEAKEKGRDRVEVFQPVKKLSSTQVVIS